MDIAYDFRGGLIIRDIEGKIHIFQPEEAQAISTACYKYAQKKTAGKYK